MERSEQYSRLLRWYPRKWRERNGEVLLSTMLEQAEESGQTAPSASEHATAAVYGLGSRLGTRFALRCAVLALGLAVVAGLLTTWGLGLFAEAGAGWVLPVLAGGACPLLVSIGVLALLRERGVISEPRALALVPLVTVALALAVLSSISWAAGFAAADAGMAMPAFAAAWSWLVVAAWAIGAVAIAVLLDGLLRKTRLPRWLVLVLSLVAGVIAAPIVGISLVSPYSSGVAAIALGITVLATGGNHRVASAVPAVPRALSARSRDVARLLFLVTAVAGAVGVAYALTGSRWFQGGPDATIAMGQGITISLIGALPLLGACGILLTSRSRLRPMHTWAPLVLLAGSFVGITVAYQYAPEWDGMAPGFVAAAVFGGAATGWFVAARLPGRIAVRVMIGVLIGLVSAAFLGVMILPLLAFLLPLLALALAIWTPGTPSRDLPDKTRVTYDPATAQTMRPDAQGY